MFLLLICDVIRLIYLYLYMPAVKPELKGVYQIRGNHIVSMFKLRVKLCHHMRGLPEGHSSN